MRMRQSASPREWSRRVREWRRSGKTSKELAAESGVNAGMPAVVKQAGPGAGALRERRRLGTRAGRRKASGTGGKPSALGRRLRIFRLTAANILVFSTLVFLQLSSWVQLLQQRRPGMCLWRVALRQQSERAFAGGELGSDYECGRLVLLALTPLSTGAGRLTIDVDGTVIRTGAQVARAFPGFNPHQRKVPSYYPVAWPSRADGADLALRSRPRQCPRPPCSALSDDASKGDAR